jgi:hypothetical protein
MIILPVLAKGAILHAALSFLKTHRRSCLRHFKCIGADVNAGLEPNKSLLKPGRKSGPIFRTHQVRSGLTDRLRTLYPEEDVGPGRRQDQSNRGCFLGNAVLEKNGPLTA